ncbi:ABC-type nitrate/sulfonate/bicarbonate transport system substrate-binding protein [Bradyrhizobium sp. USDA 4486]
MTPSHLRRALTAGLVAAVVTLAPARAETLDKVTFGTNWVAEAEHGGFFQAVADGTYKKYGPSTLPSSPAGPTRTTGCS